MKSKRKTDPFIALGVVLGVLLGAVVMNFLFDCALCAITYTPNESLNGFDEWDPERWSRLESPLDVLIEKDFLAEYPYADGDYHVDWYESFLGPWRSRRRSFIWLTYDDPAVYEAAKQSHVETRLSDLSLYGEHEAYGFRFYTIGYNAIPVGFVDNWRKHVLRGFPGYFDAFGFNDETRTLIFLSFEGGGKRENKYIELGNSDYPAFLDHYYGD